jgi:predicted RNA-binding protein YlqC (UPF0109 family)
MSQKWAAAGVAAGVVGVAALGGACAYFLLKEDDEFKFKSGHTSSRPMTIEVRIPHGHVGVVIGRGGQTIKEIQITSNTRINFRFVFIIEFTCSGNRGGRNSCAF